MFCTNCGAQLDDGVKFCTVCGAKVGADPGEATASSNMGTLPVNTPSPQDPVQGKQTQQTQTGGPSQIPYTGPGQTPYQGPQQMPYTGPQMQPGMPGQEPKKSKAWIPIVIVAGVLLLVGIVVLSLAGLNMLRKRGEEARIEASSEENEKKRDREPDVGTRDEDKDKDTEKEEPAAPVLSEGGVTEIDLSDDSFSIEVTELVEVPSSVYDELKKLEGDLNTINWTGYYSLKGAEKIVVTTAPARRFDDECVVVGVTNLYDHDAEIYGTYTMYDGNGREAGAAYESFNAISHGGTNIAIIDCYQGSPEKPGVELTVDSPYEQEGYWEADWGLSGNLEAGQLTCEYKLYNLSSVIYTTGYMHVFTTDASGNILGMGEQYAYRILRPNETQDGSLEIYGEPDELGNTEQVAMFVQTYVADESEIFLDEDNTAYFEDGEGNRLFVNNNQDGSCGVIFEAKDAYTYRDPYADLYTGAISFGDHDSGSYVGTMYISYGECSIYIYDGIVDAVPKDTEFKLKKTELSSSEKEKFRAELDSLR